MLTEIYYFFANLLLINFKDQNFNYKLKFINILFKIHFNFIVNYDVCFIKIKLMCFKNIL
jgi:hypothetical protein